MPRSTSACLVRSFDTLTRAQRQLRALLDQASPDHPLPISSRAREQLLAFDACLEASLRELVLEMQRPAADIRRVERVWAEAARQWAKAGDGCRVFDHPDAAPPSA